MNSIIERRLDETATQLQFARTIKFSAVSLCAVTLAVLIVGLAAKASVVTSSGLAWGLVAFILAGGFLIWFVAVLVIAGSPLERAELAHETERTNPGLMDRLHTLIALGPRRRVPRVESYAGRIEQQSVSVVARTESVVPLVPGDSRRWILTWLALCLLTLVFFQWFRPFSQLGMAANTPPPAPEQTPGLELPPTAEEKKKSQSDADPWIEARILEPGQDLVVTRYETVPLRVEAATSGELSRVDLHTTRNGEAAPDRQLPSGADPRFSRNEELLDLERIGAGDWDVLSYHATAESKDGMKGGSRMYFVEVRPFREEIEQLPGGVEGEPYRVLNELTNMVDAQEDAIRAAHRMTQWPADRITGQMSSDLAQAQEVMKSGVEYLRSSLPDSAELSPSIEHLNQAAESFKQAADQFRSGQTKEGEQTAQKALGQLAATRKEIHQAVKEHPEVLPKSPSSTDPLVDMTEQLTSADELQNELRDAAEQAAELADAERKIAQQIKPCDNAVHRQAAEEQRQLREKFDAFRKENSQACQRAGGQTSGAEAKLNSAMEALEKLAAEHSNPNHQQGNRATADAASALQQLAKALREQAAKQQMAAANQLQQALEDQIEFLEKLEENPDGATQEQLEQAAKNMQATTDQIKKMAEEPATREQFSDELREMLNDENKERLDKQ
jgi:hypothetical protein